MTTSELAKMQDADEIEGGVCKCGCGTTASERTCDDCGVSGWIIDCGSKSQPRPIAADGHHTYCDACSDTRAAAEDADPADLIRVEEDGPCGPRAFVPDGVDAETVLERLPDGWTVADDDWNNGVPNDDMDGHWHPMSEIEYCACGCGEEADTTVRMLPESDRDTASALGWAELSIAPMRQPVRVVEGHEDDVPDYIARDDEGETDDE